MYVVSKPKDVPAVYFLPSNDICQPFFLGGASCAVTGFSDRGLLSNSVSGMYFLADCGYLLF